MIGAVAIERAMPPLVSAAPGPIPMLAFALPELDADLPGEVPPVSVGADDAIPPIPVVALPEGAIAPSRPSTQSRGRFDRIVEARIDTTGDAKPAHDRPDVRSTDVVDDDDTPPVADSPVIAPLLAIAPVPSMQVVSSPIADPRAPIDTLAGPSSGTRKPEESVAVTPAAPTRGAQQSDRPPPIARIPGVEQRVKTSEPADPMAGDAKPRPEKAAPLPSSIAQATPLERPGPATMLRQPPSPPMPDAVVIVDVPQLPRSEREARQAADRSLVALLANPPIVDRLAPRAAPEHAPVVPTRSPTTQPADVGRAAVRALVLPAPVVPETHIGRQIYAGTTDITAITRLAVTVARPIRTSSERGLPDRFVLATPPRDAEPVLVSVVTIAPPTPAATSLGTSEGPHAPSAIEPPTDRPASFAVDTAALGGVGAEVSHRGDAGKSVHVHFAVERSATAAIIASDDGGLDRALAATGVRLDAVSVEVRGAALASEAGLGSALDSGGARGGDPRREHTVPLPAPPPSIRTIARPVTRDRFA